MACVGVVSVTGCGRQSRLALQQPFAPRSQQNVQLRSEWAYSDFDEGRQKFLLAFPLPGAEAGPRDFLIYLDCPDRIGDVEIGGGGRDAGRGFLIQAVGELAGRTHFSGGRVRIGKVFLAPRYRRLEVDLACTDGTRVFGTAFADRAAYEVRAFETRHAADIATLGSPASQPAASTGAAAADPGAPR
jgi:hypothetical protein